MQGSGFRVQDFRCGFQVLGSWVEVVGFKALVEVYDHACAQFSRLCLTTAFVPTQPAAKCRMLIGFSKNKNTLKPQDIPNVPQVLPIVETMDYPLPD